MGNSWYPENEQELKDVLKKYLKNNIRINKKANGIIVPHAGYQYSGAVAGKAFSFIQNPKIKKAIILGPSHYIPINSVITSDKISWHTPLGEIRLFNTGFAKGNINQEHSITNQVPFLQKLNFEQIMPLMVGNITDKQAQETAEKISKIPAVYVFSTDLSHFLPYEEAAVKDKKSIKIIKSLDFNNIKKIDACGICPLLIMMHLCKLKKTKPELIEYKNSGDITGDKSGVVGYASFYF